MRELRFDIPTVELLRELLSAPLPLGFRSSATGRSLHRDIYLDTADATLQRRGVICRFRFCADDRRILTVEMGNPEEADGRNAQRFSAFTEQSDPRVALGVESPPVRRLRGVVDPASLGVVLQLETERWTRRARRGWLEAQVAFLYDIVTVQTGAEDRSFQELVVFPLGATQLVLDKLGSELGKSRGLRVSRASQYERARLLLKWMRREQEPGTGQQESGNVRTGAGETGSRTSVASVVPGASSPGPHSTRALASRARASVAVATASVGGGGASEFLNSELSLLEFNARVLALAEDPAIPLLERLRFLAIVSANNDEFFMVRVAGLKDEAIETSEERSQDGLTVDEQLMAIALRVPPFLERQYGCYTRCMADLAKHGVRVVAWNELNEAHVEYLREYFRDELYPALTPFAMTLSPGHPFPTIPHLSLSLAVLVLDPRHPPAHFAEVELPERMPRFVRLPGCGHVIAMEEIVRANLAALYPDAHVEQAWMFRITRSGELMLEEKSADNLLEAVHNATTRRTRTAVVRVEVERGMPDMLRDLLLQQLKAERGTDADSLTLDDVYETPGLLDLRCLNELASLPLPQLRYLPLESRGAIPTGDSMLDQIAERDLLVHHPFDDFARTVQRFIIEAADDADVSAIKLTLYRAGEHSSLLDALIKAAVAGKEVIVLVELKARFDEARNVSWARRLEEAGGRVVYGVVGFKNHAKTTLVIRRQSGTVQRFVHVGTGNYNAATARLYTDLSFFTSDEDIASDVSDLFNELTGASRPPQRASRRCLIAPTHMLDELVRRIELEAQHAAAGREGRIRIKINGLSDARIIRALYDASASGVEIDLIVRGICTLRPGVPGLSERIRVRSILGRFLEHSRIYHFANGGAPEYLLGSADLRPRNLRHRVELLVPVPDPDCRAELERLLDLYMNDTGAWYLTPHGEYIQPRSGGGSSAQDSLMNAQQQSTSLRGNGE
ncbi:MAG: polyphosphate kinase 1 [Anaerolineae bacterium]|nr:polyphosphate kinase 1 [Gemmatimonadaceae bacterium]